MSRMTLTIGTGTAPAANRSGYAYDGLNQYPDIAWSEGYVFRAGTGWWQEWETIFPTYDAATATVTVAEYADLGGASANLYGSNSGTGWTEAFSGLFPSIQETDPDLATNVVARRNFRGCPPFVGNRAPFVPVTSVGTAQHPTSRKLQHSQTNLSLTPELIDAAVAGTQFMRFSGVGEYYRLTGTVTFQYGYLAILKTTSAATQIVFQNTSSSTPANIVCQLGSENGNSVGWVSLTASPTVIANPGPLTPNVAIADGAIHAISYQGQVSQTSMPICTDATNQTFSAGSNISTNISNNLQTLGCNALLAQPFDGDVFELVFLNQFLSAATMITVNQKLTSQW